MDTLYIPYQCFNQNIKIPYLSLPDRAMLPTTGGFH